MMLPSVPTGASNVPQLTMTTGGALILLGLVFFVLTGEKTALIPLPFGVLIALCGYLARLEGFRKHMMHAAVILALLGALGPVMQLPKVLGAPGRGLAATEMLIMLVVCLAFIILAVRSFIAARRARNRLMDA